MKCGSFRLISHLSPLTSWQSCPPGNDCLVRGRGFLGLILLFGSGLVKPFSGGERECFASLLTIPQDFTVCEGRFIVCIASGIV